MRLFTKASIDSQTPAKKTGCDQPFKPHAQIHAQTYAEVRILVRALPQFSMSVLLLVPAMSTYAADNNLAIQPTTTALDSSISEAIQQAELAKQAASKVNVAMPTDKTNSNAVIVNPTNIAAVPSLSDDEAAKANQQDEKQANDALAQAKLENQHAQQVAAADKAQADDGSTTKPKENFLMRMWHKVHPVDETVVPKISVQVVGAPHLLAKNIQAKLQDYTVDAFSDFRASLAELRRMAKDASEAVGYYNAEFRFEQVSHDTLKVIVTPHDPVIVRTEDIQFDGEAADDKTFKAIQQKPDLKVGAIMNDQLYEQTKARINTAATDKGYFDGYWQMHDAKVTLPDNTADIRLKYDGGERYKFGQVVFQNTNPAKPLPLKPALLQKLVPFKAGDDYSNGRLNTLSRNLSDTRYFSSVQVDTVIPEPIIKPLLPLEDGSQPTPDKSVESNNKTSTSADLKATAGMVDESQFAGVNKQTKASIQQQLSEAERKAKEKQQQAAEVRQSKIIPVVVSINADKPNNAELGLGYGTDTGVRVRGQYRRALLNDSGHSLDVNTEVSQIRQAVDMRYNIPYKDPLKDVYSLIGGVEREQQGNIGHELGLVTTSMTVGAEHVLKPQNNNGWQHTYSVRYRLDELQRQKGADVSQTTLPPPFNIDNAHFTQQSLLFGYGLNKVYTEGGRLDPVRGFHQFYRVDVGSQALLTDTDLAILRAGWHGIDSFGEDNNHQIVARLDAGSILTKKFEDVPYNLRFFAGGDDSIRGYDYKSLSTKKNGYLIGGQNLAVGSMEYNYQFVPKWRGAVFVDAGNAFNFQFSDPVKVGAGFGVRWSSPVGPIRIDIAAGLSETHIPIRLHFFIGPQL